MEPNFEKANEIYFRLGIIYKHQSKFDNALECFKYILSSPPPPLTDLDIRFQIGHVHEMQKDYVAAKEVYEKILEENAAHAKTLQQLGWLYHLPSSFQSLEQASALLAKSLEAGNGFG